MTFQYSATLRNNQVAQIQSTGGGSATLVIYTGSEPANCAATATGTLLVTMTLPATFMGTPSAGAVAMTGSWSGTATNPGTAGYFRILDGSSVCHVQGSAGTSGTDLILNNASIVATQTVSVISFTVTAGNS